MNFELESLLREGMSRANGNLTEPHNSCGLAVGGASADDAGFME